MRIALLLVFIAVPLLEIALLIKAGDSFGFWPTIAIVIFTAILGTVMLRLQGMAVMMRASETLNAGKMPVESVADGVFLLLAGAFLLTPGLVTDSIGLALLVPAVRRWIGNRVLLALRSKMGMDGFEPGRGPSAGSTSGQGPQSGPTSSPRRSGGKVIDAEYTDIDAPTADDKRRS